MAPLSELLSMEEMLAKLWELLRHPEVTSGFLANT
jgi:hypothetical protein